MSRHGILGDFYFDVEDHANDPWAQSDVEALNRAQNIEAIRELGMGAGEAGQMLADIAGKDSEDDWLRVLAAAVKGSRTNEK